VRYRMKINPREAFEILLSVPLLCSVDPSIPGEAVRRCPSSIRKALGQLMAADTWEYPERIVKLITKKVKSR
jgi:hypothetical protein